jgi:hypothetical protein
MLRDFPLSITDWFAWTPGRETRTAWRAWSRLGGGKVPAVMAMEEPADHDGLVALPMMLRRRIDSFSQKVLGAALACGDLRKGRYVFASRHGEFSRTRRILGDLADRQPPSPADFSMSVHNALAGLLSIHTGNKGGHITVSSGSDAFGAGLLEAVAGLADQSEDPTLLVCYDEPLPDEYADFEPADGPPLPMILVLKLDRAGATGQPLRFSVTTTNHPDGAAASSADGLIQDFLTFFLSDRVSGSSVGERFTWRWHRAA